MSLTEYDVRRIVREELARNGACVFKFGDRVRYTGVSFPYATGVGVVVSELDSDGDLKVYFKDDCYYITPSELVPE